MKRDVTQAVAGIVTRKQGDCDTYIGTSRLTKIMVDRSMGVQGASVSFVTMPPSGETEKHEKSETEIIFVVHGTLRLNTERGSVTIGAGDGGAILPGTMHSHQNPGNDWNEFLVIIAPDGPEQGFKGRSTLEAIKVER